MSVIAHGLLPSMELCKPRTSSTAQILFAFPFRPARFAFISAMKKRLLSVLLLTIFAATGALTAETGENQRLQEGKITKNEAQHLVLKQFPGATIKSCDLETTNGHSVWVVSFMKAGDKNVGKVQVDGQTGKITP
jgi:uncharacterized membrane protein YkoI